MAEYSHAPFPGNLPHRFPSHITMEHFTTLSRCHSLGPSGHRIKRARSDCHFRPIRFLPHTNESLTRCIEPLATDRLCRHSYLDIGQFLLRDLCRLLLLADSSRDPLEHDHNLELDYGDPSPAPETPGLEISITSDIRLCGDGADRIRSHRSRTVSLRLG